MMFERVREIIATTIDVNADEITMETSLQDDLGADSLDILEMIMVLEDEYSIAIDIESEMADITTVGDVVEFLKSRGLE